MLEDNRFRRKTAADWLETNVILAAGRPGFESDTGRSKIGDGSTRWSDLPYLVRTSDAEYSGSGTSSILDGGTV